MMNITVFGTPVCPNCKTVTSYLQNNDITYNYKTIGKDVEKIEVDKLTGRNVRSVPVILVNGTETTFNRLKHHVQYNSR